MEIRRIKLNTPTNLLLEAGGGYEILEEELYDKTAHEKAQSEEIVIISGTITISP